MKSQNRKTKRKKGTPAKAQTQERHEPAKERTTRRDFLTNSAIYTSGVAALAVGGWYVFDTVSASAAESDLSVIGNGVPTVVQIHDPNCPTCNALRREAREAVCEFDESELQFRVASLQTEDGLALARRHGAGKITLLMFDAKGSMTAALPGMNYAENLKPVFERHVGRYGNRKPGA